jgi:glycosyltransferase involved in cell wall biosynthesis
MRVIVATVQVPFIRGGAEIQAEELVKALHDADHEAEIVAIPFKRYPPERILDCMSACCLLDLSDSCGQAIDKLIALKFPAYFIRHPNKAVWLIHQYKMAYHLWATTYCDLIRFSNGTKVRETIIDADNKLFSECTTVFTNSINVSRRLKQFNGVDSIPLYHPPKNANIFYCKEEKGYFLFPSRLTPIKRQELVIEALVKTKNPVKVLFIGKADRKAYEEQLLNLAERLLIKERVAFLGSVSEDEKLKLYAEALGIIYPPFEEDYGYVTLEAMLASKPVVTCNDSGGSLEFVFNNKTGLITEPTPEALASALDHLWDNRSWAKAIGKVAREYYENLDISWSHVLNNLLES